MLRKLEDGLLEEIKCFTMRDFFSLIQANFIYRDPHLMGEIKDDSGEILAYFLFKKKSLDLFLDKYKLNIFFTDIDNLSDDVRNERIKIGDEEYILSSVFLPEKKISLDNPFCDYFENDEEEGDDYSGVLPEIANIIHDTSIQSNYFDFSLIQTYDTPIEGIDSFLESGGYFKFEMNSNLTQFSLDIIRIWDEICREGTRSIKKSGF